MDCLCFFPRTPQWMGDYVFEMGVPLALSHPMCGSRGPNHLAVVDAWETGFNSCVTIDLMGVMQYGELSLAFLKRKSVSFYSSRRLVY